MEYSKWLLWKLLPDHVSMKREKGLVWYQHQGLREKKSFLTEEVLDIQ